MTALTLEHLSVRRGARTVVQDASFSIGAGEYVGLLGPNGAGKTSLMRAALGLIAHDGHSSLSALAPVTRARHCAWLPQARKIAWGMHVERVVRLGRIPHSGDPSQAVDAAIHRMDLDALRQRSAAELSGGEQARVLIARALAQDTPLLMADEPIAGLDPAHQIATMQVFGALAAEGRSVMVSLHDLGLAARHCTRLVAMDEGRIIADGPPREVLTPALLADVFGVTAFHEETAEGPIFQPLEVIR